MGYRKTAPSKIVVKILNRLLSQSKNYGFYGDLEEIYRLILAEQGKRTADFWLWKQIFKTIPAAGKESIYWGAVWLSGYFKITFRNFRRQKTFSLINITGLAVGIACSLCISLFVHYELSFDRFHRKSDRIFRLAMTGGFSNRPFNVALSSGPAGPNLAREFPEINDYVRLQRGPRTTVEYQGKLFLEQDYFWADRSFFNIFSFPLVKGDPNTALDSPFSAVLTEAAAKHYFGAVDPIGKTLKFNQGAAYTVTALIKDIPAHSHIHFNLLLSLETLATPSNSRLNNWTQFVNYTYLLLSKNADPWILEGKFPAFIEAHLGDVVKASGWNLQFILQPLTRIHLHSHLDAELSANSQIAYVYIFASIALLILLLAGINFTNLAAHQAVTRAKEIGVRKVLGAHKNKLMRQFLIESLLYSFTSLIAAILLIPFILPVFNSASGLDLKMSRLEIFRLLPVLLGLGIMVGLTSGALPALVLSRFEPVKVLKGVFFTRRGKNRLRSLLVAFQLTASIFLITGTMIIYHQMYFLKNHRLGFDKEHVLILENPDSRSSRAILSLKEELSLLPGVLGVTASSYYPGQGGLLALHLPEGFSRQESQSMRVLNIDSDYLNTMGIEISEGRNFSPLFPGDTQNSALINETAAKKLGWENPIGKTVQQIYGGQKTLTIIGVVKDFFMSSLHDPIEPMFITNSPPYNFLCIRISPDNLENILASVRLKWEKTAPNSVFNYFFLDQAFDSLYRNEEKLSRIFSYFSLLAILIAGLGLFGMAGHAARQRTKEIGIRKVLGASAIKITYLLSRDIFRLFILAHLTAWPLASLAARSWLGNFAHHVRPDFWIFIASGSLVFAVCLAAVMQQSISAALTNPAETLKYE